jgi:hypothetical protein
VAKTHFISQRNFFFTPRLRLGRFEVVGFAIDSKYWHFDPMPHNFCRVVGNTQNKHTQPIHPA